MDPVTLKKNFEEQIAKTDTQIRELEENLVKAKEYKIKLQGGLETINLLEEKPEEKADKKTSKGMGSSKLKVIKEVIEEKPLDGTADNQNEAKETEDPGVF